MRQTKKPRHADAWCRRYATLLRNQRPYQRAHRGRVVSVATASPTDDEAGRWTFRRSDRARRDPRLILITHETTVRLPAASISAPGWDTRTNHFQLAPQSTRVGGLTL